MATASLVLMSACVLLLTCTHAKIGYFWHITDFHYDPLYSLQGDTRKHCHKTDDRGSSGHHRSLGRFGDYACDSPQELVASALRYMRTRHTENIEFVLWTGDIVSSKYSTNEDDRYQAIRNMTELLRMTFSSHFVFPVLGNTDPPPSDRLTNLWSHWLPLEALQTLKNEGYYTIEQTQSKLRIVALNTNLFSIRDQNTVHARRQWEWLDSVLEKATANKEMVYIVGHAAPGSDSRYNSISIESNDKYLSTVRRHAKIIAGQFFGHLHADTFRVIYDQDVPVSWALLAPSLSPRHELGGASNPGLRLYKFDTDNGKVLDYTQFYLDLAAANRAEGEWGEWGEWGAEYNLTQYYALRDVSAPALHQLAERLRGDTHGDATFARYLRAYSVSHESAAGGACSGACALAHYCAVTCVERRARRTCEQARAAALAAATRARAPRHPPLLLAVPLLLLLLPAYSLL